MDDFFEILKQAVGPLVAAMLAIWMYSKDRPKREDDRKTGEVTRFKLLLDEIQEERDNLKKEIDNIKKDCQIREDKLNREITALRQEIIKLRDQISGVERKTERLERQTGPLKKV